LLARDERDLNAILDRCKVINADDDEIGGEI